MKKLSLILLTTMLMLLIPIHLVKADNWVEVIRFEGKDEVSTKKYFTCDHVEWRIRWEFDPGHWHFPQLHTFSVTTYRQGDDMHYVDSIFEMADGSKSGTSYIHDNYGQYYMIISTGIIANYTIIIDQNIDSIPEFPSWVILPLLLVTTVAAAAIRKHLRPKPLLKRGSQSRFTGRRLP
jgi:hypothetical protein